MVDPEEDHRPGAPHREVLPVVAQARAVQAPVATSAVLVAEETPVAPVQEIEIEKTVDLLVVQTTA